MGELNIQKISELISKIIENAQALEVFKSMSLEEFEESRSNYAIAEHNLRRALGGVISVTSHIISRIPGASKNKDYTEILLALGEYDIVPREFAQKIRGMAGYRNRLVHMYHEVRAPELYEKIKKDLDDFEEFVKYIREYMKNA